MDGVLRANLVGFVGGCGPGALGEDVPHLVVCVPVQGRPPGIPGCYGGGPLGRGGCPVLSGEFRFVGGVNIVHGTGPVGEVDLVE